MITKKIDVIKLWAHECLRVFRDRLINEKDRMCFDEILEKMLLENFKVNSKGSNPDVDRENIYFCGFAEIN